MSDVSGVPVPGRPPGHQHGCGAWPAAAGQCSKQSVHGLPTPRAGSEYEDDLRARGADFKSSGTSDHVPGLGSQTLAQPGNDMELLLAAELLSAMLEALRVQAVHFRDENERLCAQYKDIAQRLEDIAQERENELLCVQAVHSLVAQERPCAQDKNNAQYLEQENELLCVQAVHSLVAQERPCAQDKDNAQYLEQENDEGTGVREMDTTPTAVKIFAVVHQDRYISTAADAPRQAARSTSRSRARSRPTRARTPSASRTSTSQSTPAPWSRLAPSHASGLTTKSTLEYCSRRPSALLFYTQGRLKG